MNDSLTNVGLKFSASTSNELFESVNFDLNHVNNKLELFYEWIDGLHFYMNFAISIGMTSKDIVNLYMAKNAENHDRQNRGY